MISIQYAAGFFDGEGCVYVDRRTPQNGYNSRIPHYRVRVSIANTNEEIMLLFHRRWNGTLKLQSASNPRHNSAWHWQVYSQQTVPFLEELLPYLVVKRKVAELALLMAKSYREEKFCRYRPIDNSVASYREALFIDMRKLNTKGPSNFKKEDMTEVNV